MFSIIERHLLRLSRNRYSLLLPGHRLPKFQKYAKTKVQFQSNLSVRVWNLLLRRPVRVTDPRSLGEKMSILCRQFKRCHGAGALPPKKGSQISCHKNYLCVSRNDERFRIAYTSPFASEQDLSTNMKNEIFLALAAALIEQEDEDSLHSRSSNFEAPQDQDDTTATALLSLRNVTAVTWKQAQPLCHPAALSSFASASPTMRSVSGARAVVKQACGVTPISDDEDDGDGSSRLAKKSALKKRKHSPTESRARLSACDLKVDRIGSSSKRLRRTGNKSRAVIPLSSFTTQAFIGRPLPPAPCLPRLPPGQRLPLSYTPK